MKGRSYIKLGVVLFAVYILIRYWGCVEILARLFVSSVLPLIVGLVIAYVVNILMSFYEESIFEKNSRLCTFRYKRVCSMILAFVSVLAVIGLVIGLVIPELVGCAKLIISEIPDFMKDVEVWCRKKDLFSDELLDSVTQMDWKKYTEGLLKTLTSGVGSAVGVIITTLSSVFSGIVVVAVAIVFAIYLLSGKETLTRQLDKVCKYYLNDKLYSRGKYVLGVFNDCFHKYIVGQCIEAVILGIMCVAGMLILRLPYAMMIGTLVGFTALVPIVGAYIGAVVGCFMIFTVSPIKALVFLIFILVLQQFEGNVVYPRVVGSSLGLPAVWVLTAVTVGGGMLGIGGMMLGVPITAAVYRLIGMQINKPDKNAKHKQSDSGQKYTEKNKN